MNNLYELLLILVIVITIVGPVEFVRFKLYNRFVRSQESIAESLRKIVENQAKDK
jgi:hypothetical protein